jgi:hypothetical protein
MFLVVNEPEEQEFSLKKKSKFQQILGNMFRAEFLNFSVIVLIVGQPKKSGKWRKFHGSANQIPESAEILLFGVCHQKHVKSSFLAFDFFFDC